MPDFLSVADLGAEGLRRALDVAADAKTQPQRYSDRLAGMAVGLFFMKPSTRTRVSSELAAVQMGAHAVVLGQEEVGLGTRESVEDVARVLDRYLDVLAFRVFAHGDLVEMAEHAQAPVINLLSDAEHPCQAAADLLTIEEHIPIGKSTVAYVGDGNNVCHSLMLAGAMLGARIRVITPVGYEPASEFVERARLLGDEVEVTHDLAGIDGADVVYTDIWASMGQESEQAERAEAFTPYQVNLGLFQRARPDAIFLHCLPAHRGDEVTDEVADHERSRVFDQAENRLHAFKAILLSVLE